MKERNLALIISFIIAIIGIIIGIITSIYTINSFYLPSTITYNEFNFYKSELNINDSLIKETLYFSPDKPYHTLFRTFDSQITTKLNTNLKNSVSIISVDCEFGEPYFRINNNCYLKPDFSKPEICPQYTENNEYGCTFGDFLGFDEDSIYKISSEFNLNPENLFKINNKYYIKFIAYAQDKHTNLIKNQNLFISGDFLSIDNYKSNEYVIIYIPYNRDITNFKIIEKQDFEYDITKEKTPPKKWFIILIIIFIIIFHLLPAILFYCSWYYFGKELIEPNVPEQRSDYPNKRKPWEVAAFFNPPFAILDKNFYSSILLDFYRRKIIDLKLKKGFFKDQLLVKINEDKIIGLDKIEDIYMKILKYIRYNADKKYFDGDYFNLNKASKQYDLRTQLVYLHEDLKDSVKKDSKKYYEKKGIGFFVLFMLGLILITFLLFFLKLYLIGLIAFSIALIIIIPIISIFSTLLLKYKGEFYKEYIEWQSFKNWLKYSDSMKEHGHKGVVLWEEYLVYATALGVSKQVLKELKQEGLINENQYKTYSGINTAVISFSGSPGAASSGGGFGGAGGGGVGGGGGGGR